MGTLEPKVKRMLAERDIKGLIKVLQDESDGNGYVWASAYAALTVIADEVPLSNSDISKIIEAIAEYFLYQVTRVFHFPWEGKKHYEKDIKKFQTLLNNYETFRVGRLPNKLVDELLPSFVDSYFKPE